MKAGPDSVSRSIPRSIPVPYPIHTRTQSRHNKCQYESPILLLLLLLLLLLPPAPTAAAAIPTPPTTPSTTAAATAATTIRLLLTFTSTTVTATAISTAAASYPSIATTAAGAVFVFSAPSTSSGNSFSSNSSRRRSNSKSGSISTVCMLWWALTKGYGSGTLRKHSRSIVRITAERSIPDFWLAPISQQKRGFITMPFGIQLHPQVNSALPGWVSRLNLDCRSFTPLCRMGFKPLEFG